MVEKTVIAPEITHVKEDTIIPVNEELKEVRIFDTKTEMQHVLFTAKVTASGKITDTKSGHFWNPGEATIASFITLKEKTLNLAT